MLVEWHAPHAARPTHWGALEPAGALAPLVLDVALRLLDVTMAPEVAEPAGAASPDAKPAAMASSRVIFVAGAEVGVGG